MCGFNVNLKESLIAGTRNNCAGIETRQLESAEFTTYSRCIWNNIWLNGGSSAGTKRNIVFIFNAIGTLRAVAQVRGRRRIVLKFFS